MSEQLALSLPVRAASGREDFIVAPCNARAVDRIDAWPEWADPVQYIHGPAGCGKSHLASVWMQRHAAQLVQADTINTTAKVLVTGSVTAQPIRGWLLTVLRLCQRAGEEVVFHVINHARANHRHVLLLAREAPIALPVRLADLRSRLAALDALAFGLPDDTLLSALFDKLFRDRQLAVDARVIQYLLPRVERNFTILPSWSRALMRLPCRAREPFRYLW